MPGQRPGGAAGGDRDGHAGPDQLRGAGGDGLLLEISRWLVTSNPGSMALAVSIAVAPPCTLDSRPLRSSISRSRRTVMSETPSRAVSCATLAPPVRRTSSRILAWRMAASTSASLRRRGAVGGADLIERYRIATVLVFGTCSDGPAGPRRRRPHLPGPADVAVGADGDRIGWCPQPTIAPAPAAARFVRAADIDAAARRIAGVAALTPLEECPRLSPPRPATTVLLKREDLQVVRSYKLRGAYNLMSQLTPAERAAGVVCASAGNHAQGVAFACRALDIKGRIYLPNTTPRQKRDRILSHGGGMVELVLTGDTFDDAALAAPADAEPNPGRCWCRRSTTGGPSPVRAPSSASCCSSWAGRRT